MAFKSNCSSFYAVLLCTFLLVLDSTSAFAAWQSPPKQFPYFGLVIDVGADANGHAVAVYTDDFDNLIKASYYTSGVWGNPVVIGEGPAGSLAVDMNDSGIAMAVWYNLNTGDVLTARFNGSTWSTPVPSPLITISSLDPLNEVAVAVNGLGDAIALVINNSSAEVFSFTYSNGSWVNTLLEVGDSDATIAFSSNGSAVAGWTNGSAETVVANYTSGIWSTPVVLDAGPSNGVQVGIDATGQALAVWLNSFSEVVSSSFTGVTWQPPVTISGAPGNFNPSLDMAPSGTAVAIWVDPISALRSSSYNGTLWGSPLQVTLGPVDQSIAPQVAVNNSNGAALAVWATTTPDIRSSRLSLGEVWQPEELITTPASPIGLLNNALSSNGTGFAVWTEQAPDPLFFNLFADATLPIARPSSLNGFVCKNNFASQTDRINIITWTASLDPTVVAYLVRRNGDLIAEIPSTSRFIFKDHNRCKKIPDTYSVTAVDINGIESAALSITLPLQ